MVFYASEGITDWRGRCCEEGEEVREEPVAGATARVAGVEVEPASGVVRTEGGATEEGRTDSAATCCVCRVKLRRGVTGMECAGCGTWAHRKCCGLNRWQRDRGEEWRCARCRGENGEERVQTERRLVAAGKCDGCGKTRRVGQGIMCRSCGTVLHVKCAELGSRTQAEGVNREEWDCTACVQQQREATRDPMAGDRVPLMGAAVRGMAGLVVAQWNCDHLAAKIPQLEVWLRKYDVDVAVLQESKLRAEDGEVRVRGYQVVRRDRWRAGNSRWSRGGGVVTLVRQGLHYRQVEVGVPRDGVVEALAVEVVGESGAVWRVLNLYVPPEARGRLEEENLRALPDCREGRWLVCGDWNAHDVMWDEWVSGDRRGEMVLEWMSERELRLLNDGAATRRGRGTGNLSAPDLSMVSDDLAQDVQWEVVRELGSDHFPILIRGNGDGTTGGSQERVLAWDWKRADWEGYQQMVREEVGRVEWSRLGVKEKEEKLRSLILKAARRWVGTRKRRVRDELVSETILKEMERRDSLVSREEVDWEAVAESEGRIKVLVKEEKEESWRRLLEKRASQGEMWGMVKGIKRGAEGRREGGEMMLEGGRVLVTARQRAEGFAREYERVSRVKVRGRRMKARVNAMLREVGPEPADSCEIGVEEVRAAQMEMEEGKAAGPDGLHPRLLCRLPVDVLWVVRDLFEASFRSRCVPQEWRVGEIVPLLKAGKDPSEMGSYRPVCLTSCLGKWMERVLARRLRWVLESGGVLSRFQAGFREGRSVNDQLVRLSQSAWDGYQGRLKTSLMLYDLYRAYDRVWRDGLLFKLASVGVSHTMVRWVQVWLSNRLAWVKCDGVRSKARLFQQGLPQGSVLSPLLFLVFVNDLVESLAERVEVSAFADDLAVWHTARTVEEGRERLQWAAGRVERWCEEWAMTVSVGKCSVTLLSNDRRDREMTGLEIQLSGREVQKEQFPCFLGVVFDASFTFRRQVDKVVQKAEKGVRLLRRLAGSDWGWGKSLLRVTSLAVVRAVLLYGSAAWAPWVAPSVWERVERVFKSSRGKEQEWWEAP